MAPSIAWAKTPLSALGALALLGCTEGPVHTLGEKPGPRDAGFDATDAAQDTGTDAGEDAGTDASEDAGTDASEDAGQEPPPLEFDPDTLHWFEELNSDVDDDENPTLCNDELEIYFSSERLDGGSDIYVAVRPSLDDDFGPPELIEGVSTEHFETSPAISSDCQTLWLGTDHYSEGMADVDIYEVQRGADGFVLDEATDFATLLNSTQDDIPRPPGAGGRIMPMGSRRETSYGTKYQTFLADLDGTDGPQLIDTIATPGVNFADGFLTRDGLMLLFQREGNLYYARRASESDSFAVVGEIGGVNTPEANEQDPWLSDDGERLYFTRQVGDGHLDIAMIERVPAP